MPINCLINCLINFWTIREQFVNNSCSQNKNFSPLMPINCLINFWAFARFVFQNKLMAFYESNSWTLMFQKGCAPGKRIVFQNSFTPKNTASWEVGKGERRRQRESRRQVPWGLAFTSYFLFSCACPNFSLFKQMNHWMSEGISEHDNCTGLYDGLFLRTVTSAPCA